MANSRQHKYHFIYKTTCLITDRYYIGMHSTSNLKDGYIGSGRRLWLSINKHGKENHSFEILEFLPSRLELKAREMAIVNETLLADPMCMNLQLGGGGGFISETHQLKCSAAGGQKTAALIKEDSGYSASHSTKMSIANKRAYLNGKQVKAPDWTGRTHRPEIKAKIGAANSQRQAGSSNSQFGTRWIHHPDFGNRKVNSSDLEDYLAQGYRLGRVMG
jgi:hypothetical protein